jgi:hypothetical protein
MPLIHRHNLTPNNQTGNSNSRHRKRHNTLYNRHAKNRKCAESQRLPTIACPPCFPWTPGQQQTMPLKHRNPLTPNNPAAKIVFPVTASVTTLFHNRRGKYRKHTESRRLSTIAHPSCVPSTSGQQQAMPLKHWNALTAKHSTGNSIPTAKIVLPVIANVTTLFYSCNAKYRKYTESRRLPTTAQPTVCPIDFRPTSFVACYTSDTI